MSEYQWVEFRAVDGPLNDEALAFMNQQSTRAGVSRWRFTNEYHFGTFRGDVLEMLRRGYDVHVHYTNFGLRRLCIRIPDGFAFADALKSYLLEYEITWDPDEQGTGGVLSLQPEGDAGTWDWMEDVESLTSDLVPIREMVITGDFRPLYIAHIAFSYDDDALEPPVPAGLVVEHSALDRLCSFYEVDSDLLAVAAEASAAFGQTESENELISAWVKKLSRDDLVANLHSCLTEPNRFPSQLLRSIRAGAGNPASTSLGQRTIGELRRRVSEIDNQRARERLAAAAKEAERRKAEADKALQNKLSAIAENPQHTINRIDRAIEAGNRPAYQRAAAELAMLAKACGKQVADAKAATILAKYPSRSALSSELRKAGF